MASVATGDSDCDETLPTGEWFEAKKFPRAAFSSPAIQAVATGR